MKKKIIFKVKGEVKEIETDDPTVTDEKLRDLALKCIEFSYFSKEKVDDETEFWINHEIRSL